MIRYSIDVVGNGPQSNIKLFGNGWVFVENKLVLISNHGYVTKLGKFHINVFCVAKANIRGLLVCIVFSVLFAENKSKRFMRPIK